MEIKNTYLAILALILLAALILAYRNPAINSFEQCVAAGYPVSELPRQCKTPDGRTFVEVFCGASTQGECSSDSDCITDGCSSQVCRSKYEDPVITTCEYRTCYTASAYELNCRCEENNCRWENS